MLLQCPQQTNKEFSTNAPSVSDSNIFSDNGKIKPAASQSSSLDLFDESIFEPKESIEENSFKNRMELKIQTSRLAMHLKREARDAIFSEIDYLLDPEDFDISEDSLVSVKSYKSYLRFLTYSPNAKPATLGVAFGGEVIAIWAATDDECEKTLNLEFLPDDRVKCNFSCVHSGELKEASSYIGSVKRIDDILTPYNAVSLYKYGLQEA